jgi:hypothetical protein
LLTRPGLCYNFDTPWKRYALEYVLFVLPGALAGAKLAHPFYYAMKEIQRYGS